MLRQMHVSISVTRHVIISYRCIHNINFTTRYAVFRNTTTLKPAPINHSVALGNTVCPNYPHRFYRYFKNWMLQVVYKFLHYKNSLYVITCSAYRWISFITSYHNFSWNVPICTTSCRPTLKQLIKHRAVFLLTAVFCENTQFSLWCGEAEKLKIRSAVFGRTNYLTCWNAQIFTLSCAQSATTTVQVRDMNGDGNHK